MRTVRNAGDGLTRGGQNDLGDDNAVMAKASHRFFDRSYLSAPERAAWRRRNSLCKDDRWLAYAMVLPVVLAVLGFVIGPAYDVFRLSFTRYVMGQELGFGTLVNFYNLFADPMFVHVLKNTAVWIFGGTIGCVALGLALACFLAMNGPVTAALRALILLPAILPDVVTAMAWKWMLHGQVGIVGETLKDMGLTERPISFLGDPSLVMWVLVAVVIWRKVPLVTLVLTASIRSVPSELLEASRIDGANRWESFRYVVVPAHRLSVHIDHRYCHDLDDRRIHSAMGDDRRRPLPIRARSYRPTFTSRASNSLTGVSRQPCLSSIWSALPRSSLFTSS